MEKEAEGPGAEHGRLLVSNWVFPFQGTGRPMSLPRLTPHTLQAVFLLPQCLMPGHTATEYAICVGDMSPHPHPTRAAPEFPRLWLPGLPLAPLPICLHTENGA